MSAGNNNLIAKIRTALHGGKPGQAVWLLSRIRGEARIMALEYVWDSLGTSPLIRHLMGQESWTLRSGGRLTEADLNLLDELMEGSNGKDAEIYQTFLEWVTPQEQPPAKAPVSRWGW